MAAFVPCGGSGSAGGGMKRRRVGVRSLSVCAPQAAEIGRGLVVPQPTSFAATAVLFLSSGVVDGGKFSSAGWRRRQCAVEDAFRLVQNRQVGKEQVARARTVVEILKGLQVDQDIVLAGLLRGMPCTEQEVAEEFGPRVRDIWQRDLEFRDYLKDAVWRGPGSLRFSRFRDFPCLLIELVHAVARTRHMKFASPVCEKVRAEIERNLTLHVPLADTLGCRALQSELEEMAFMHLRPLAHRKMCELVGDRLTQYGSLLGCTIRELEYVLSSLPEFRKIASFRVSGRIKNSFSIYQKMKRKGLEFDEILDLVALRVVLKPKSGVSEIDACAKVLKEVTMRWPSMESTTRDYITNPKENGYQSLHTTILASGLPMEIQIRSERMHEISEIGSAAHCSYKVETRTCL